LDRNLLERILFESHITDDPNIKSEDKALLKVEMRIFEDSIMTSEEHEMLELIRICDEADMADERYLAERTIDPSRFCQKEGLAAHDKAIQLHLTRTSYALNDIEVASLLCFDEETKKLRSQIMKK